MSDQKKKIGKWAYSGAVNMLDYGGKNIRHVGARKFQCIEFTNMDDACGRDNEGHAKYVVELSMVDLDALDAKTFNSAMSSCGPDTSEQWFEDTETAHDAVVAEACFSYGCKAPLGSWEGNNARKRIQRSECTVPRLKRTISWRYVGRRDLAQEASKENGSAGQCDRIDCR